MAASPANSGPIIAELIDELEENGNGGGTTGFGKELIFWRIIFLIQVGEINNGGYQQIGNNSMPPSGGGGQRMAMVVSSPTMPMNELIPAEEGSNFRGYSQSFGGQSAPPTKKQAYQMVCELNDIKLIKLTILEFTKTTTTAATINGTAKGTNSSSTTIHTTTPTTTTFGYLSSNSVQFNASTTISGPTNPTNCQIKSTTKITATSNGTATIFDHRWNNFASTTISTNAANSFAGTTSKFEHYLTI